MKEHTRVISFSAKPADVKGRKEIDKLKLYSAETGISFSLLIIRAITAYNKELKNDNT